MQRYELKESQVSDDFMHWFKNGEHICGCVLRKNHSKCLSYTGECHIYIWLESALHSIFQLWMSRNEGQRLCSHSLNFDLLSKSFGIYFNHITVSPQNFGKSSTHQKSPFLEVSILGYGLSVRSHPPIHKNSNISTTNEGMFMKFEI